MKKLLLPAIVIFLFIFSCQTPESSDNQSDFENLFIINFQQGHLPDSTYTGCSDTYITSAFPGNNYGSASDFAFGYNSGGNRALLRFDLVGYISANAGIKNAVLTLYAENGFGTGDYAIEAHEMSKDFVEGTDTWTTINSSFNSSVIGTATINAESQTVSINISTAVVENWLKNPLENYGIMIRKTVESGSINYNWYYSRNSATPTIRPFLTIVYGL